MVKKNLTFGVIREYGLCKEIDRKNDIENIDSFYVEKNNERKEMKNYFIIRTRIDNEKRKKVFLDSYNALVEKVGENNVCIANDNSTFDLGLSDEISQRFVFSYYDDAINSEIKSTTRGFLSSLMIASVLRCKHDHPINIFHLTDDFIVSSKFNEIVDIAVKDQRHELYVKGNFTKRSYSLFTPYAYPDGINLYPRARFYAGMMMMFPQKAEDGMAAFIKKTMTKSCALKDESIKGFYSDNEEGDEIYNDDMFMKFYLMKEDEPLFTVGPSAIDHIGHGELSTFGAEGHDSNYKAGRFIQ